MGGSSGNATDGLPREGEARAEHDSTGEVALALLRGVAPNPEMPSSSRSSCSSGNATDGLVLRGERAERASTGEMVLALHAVDALLLGGEPIPQMP